MSLLFPAYLAGLLGLALPWLLHRFSNERAEEQLFPSKRFLEATTPPVSRTQTLKYRALLALRVLSLILLCLLFAQPWISRQGAFAPVSQHHIVAVDQSLSMRTEGRWDKAIEQARSIINQLPEADSIELVGFDRNLRRLATDEESQSSLTQALQNLQPGYGAADYGAAMQSINTVAGEQDVPVKLWLISDAQYSALPAELNALYAPRVDELELRSVVDEPEHNVHLQANALSRDGVNVQINVQLLASESLSRETESQQVSSAQTRSQESGPKESGFQDSGSQDSGSQAASDRTINANVQVAFEGQVLSTQQATLHPGELKTLTFDRLVMPASNNPVFTLSLTDADDLEIDNRVDIAVKTANPTPVVLLSSERGESDNAAVFLATALETDSVAQVTEVSGTAERVPAETQHIISARNLDQPVALDVLQLVDSGANALLFRSDGVALNASQSVQGSEMALVDDAHPMSLGNLDWFGTRFFDVPNLSLLPGDRVLLQTDRQQPILVERPGIRGRLLILNDRLDGVGSNLPLQPVFVELMQSLLRYFDASTALPDQIVIGERLALPANVQVLDPDDEPLLSLDASANSGILELNEPGLYKVVGVRGEHALRVILDTQEADLATLSPTAVLAWQARYRDTADSDRRTGGATNDDTDVPEADRLLLAQGADVSRLAGWRILLPLLVLFLLLECGFANRRLDVRRDGS